MLQRPDIVWKNYVAKKNIVQKRRDVVWKNYITEKDIVQKGRDVLRKKGDVAQERNAHADVHLRSSDGTI
ncbi:uncharacterized protein LAESUDRAFT_757937 [Laetiporus sulphureus 93-53]|uniref:Uncharacterized protein n=1 Tax=Laetiporus sulphureus 93-53 TaxID=1314785 RepID=A0A165F2W0_9APHY|nr:uncharacterized protein LAESUDRAFT_757937 [Laetiporus sulphureus 93-53]KZT08259.1 hypothetical protein LAESUDRAFT_757937 [Laetiporus sulphureus 93-53]